MNKSVFALPLYLLLLSSCGDPKVVKTEVELILTSNMSNPKDEITSLVEPSQIDGIKDKFFVSYPLYVNRVDIEKKQKLDYLSNKAVNYEKVSPIKRDFKKFFEGSFPAEFFESESKSVADIDAYLDMENCFVYSDKAVGDVKMKSKTIYQDIAELRKAMASFIDKGGKKVYIIFKPELKGIVKQQPPKATDTPEVDENTRVVETTVNAKTNTSVASSSTSSNTGTQVSASSLEDYFNKLSSREIPYAQKGNLRSSIIQFFTDKNAKVVKVNNNQETLDGGTTIEDYAETLCSTHRKVYIQDKVMNGSKISQIKIQEQ